MIIQGISLPSRGLALPWPCWTRILPSGVDMIDYRVPIDNMHGPKLSSLHREHTIVTDGQARLCSGISSVNSGLKRNSGFPTHASKDHHVRT